MYATLRFFQASYSQKMAAAAVKLVQVRPHIPMIKFRFALIFFKLVLGNYLIFILSGFP